MTVGIEIKNTAGSTLIASWGVNYRYRGKVETSVAKESGSTGSERMQLTLTGATAPLIFIGGNSAGVCQTYQYQSGSNWIFWFECADNTSVNFTAYIFDATTNTSNMTVGCYNSAGTAISHTDTLIAGVIPDPGLGLQVFDASGVKSFDAVAWQLPVVTGFTLTSTLASSTNVGVTGAAIDLAMGYNAIDTGFALYQINRAMIRWSGTTLITSASNQGYASPISTTTYFKAPLILVVDTANL